MFPFASKMGLILFTLDNRWNLSPGGNQELGVDYCWVLKHVSSKWTSLHCECEPSFSKNFINSVTKNDRKSDKPIDILCLPPHPTSNLLWLSLYWKCSPNCWGAGKLMISTLEYLEQFQSNTQSPNWLNQHLRLGYSQSSWSTPNSEQSYSYRK